MTTPTVPPVTCQIEIDPLAPPCGTGLEGWGGELPEPVLVCLNGETITALYWGQVQEAGGVGACAAVPGTVAPEPVTPAALPVTGSETAIASLAAVVIAAGLCFRRFARRPT